MFAFPRLAIPVLVGLLWSAGCRAAKPNEQSHSAAATSPTEPRATATSLPDHAPTAPRPTHEAAVTEATGHLTIGVDVDDVDHLNEAQQDALVDLLVSHGVKVVRTGMGEKFTHSSCARTSGASAAC
jgi:hypothetical protein